MEITIFTVITRCNREKLRSARADEQETIGVRMELETHFQGVAYQQKTYGRQKIRLADEWTPWYEVIVSTDYTFEARSVTGDV